MKALFISLGALFASSAAYGYCDRDCQEAIAAERRVKEECGKIRSVIGSYVRVEYQEYADVQKICAIVGAPGDLEKLAAASGNPIIDGKYLIFKDKNYSFLVAGMSENKVSPLQLLASAVLVYGAYVTTHDAVLQREKVDEKRREEHEVAMRVGVYHEEYNKVKEARENAEEACKTCFRTNYEPSVVGTAATRTLKINHNIAFMYQKGSGTTYAEDLL